MKSPWKKTKGTLQVANVAACCLPNVYCQSSTREEVFRVQVPFRARQRESEMRVCCCKYVNSCITYCKICKLILGILTRVHCVNTAEIIIQALTFSWHSKWFVLWQLTITLHIKCVLSAWKIRKAAAKQCSQRRTACLTAQFKQ